MIPFPHYDSLLTPELSAGIMLCVAVCAVLLNMLSSLVEALNYDIDSSLYSV